MSFLTDKIIPEHRKISNPPKTPHSIILPSDCRGGGARFRQRYQDYGLTAKDSALRAVLMSYTRLNLF